MTDKTDSPTAAGLNAEAAFLKKRWTEALHTVGAADDCQDSPDLHLKMTLSGNAWADCEEVKELHKACVKGSTGLKRESAICQAAQRYFESCLVRDEYCQDPTEH